jgi:hypothetical protein
MSVNDVWPGGPPSKPQSTCSLSLVDNSLLLEAFVSKLAVKI